MGKRIFKYAGLTALAMLIGGSLAQIISSQPAMVAKRLIASEAVAKGRISLKINYLAVIPVASARLEDLGRERFRGADLIRLRAEAKTFDCLSSIFYARATVNSYVDPLKMLPAYFLQHLEMINKPADDREIAYDQRRHIMRYKGPRGIEQRIIDEDTHDPLSAIFYIRHKPLKAGAGIRLHFNTNQKTYLLEGKVVSQKSLKAGGQNYELLLVEARVRRKDKSRRHQFGLKIWFLQQGETSIPILIKAMTNIGPVVAVAYPPSP